MHLEKFVHSKTGKTIMSILLGIGLATFFRQVCKGKRCKIVEAPQLDTISDNIHKIKGKCYKMQKQQVQCDKNKSVKTVNLN